SRPPPCPAVLAVVTLGGFCPGGLAGNRALQAPPATGTDQQLPACHPAPIVLYLARPVAVPAGPSLTGRVRRGLPAALGRGPGRQGQAGPVGPVKQPDQFWQAGHGGTIRGKSAEETERHPVRSDYARCRPGVGALRGCTRHIGRGFTFEVAAWPGAGERIRTA